MEFLLSELAVKLGGQLHGPDITVNGVTTDSRTIGPGELFVPLVAERDGHDFIDAALDAGCAGYLSVRHLDRGSSIRVADTEDALSQLGHIARERLGAHVVGVTGSVGKTSVKDMIYATCSPAVTTHVNKGSFNNEIGLPLTLANAPGDADVVVTEMGARGVGHIRHLCKIAEPTIGVVTAVALAHSELFGTIETVAKAKAELVESLPSNGIAILNADDPNVAEMAAKTQADVITFGLDGDIRPTQITFDRLNRPSFVLETPNGSVGVNLPVSGGHMAINATAAIAVATAVGVPLDQAARGLEQLAISPWRMEIDVTASGMVIINDSYNANPTSMRAALRTLADIEASEKVAMVGAMGELGVERVAEHRNIAAEATAAGIRVIAIDAADYGPDVVHVSTLDEAVSLADEFEPTTAVLIKGSRSAGLERLADKLKT